MAETPNRVETHKEDIIYAYNFFPLETFILFITKTPFKFEKKSILILNTLNIAFYRTQNNNSLEIFLNGSNFERHGSRGYFGDLK